MGRLGTPIKSRPQLTNVPEVPVATQDLESDTHIQNSPRFFYESRSATAQVPKTRVRPPLPASKLETPCERLSSRTATPQASLSGTSSPALPCSSQPVANRIISPELQSVEDRARAHGNASTSRACSPSPSPTLIALRSGSVTADGGSASVPALAGHDNDCRVVRVRSPSPKRFLRNAPISRACSPLASPRLVALSGGPVTADGGTASVPVPGSHDNHSRTARARILSPQGFSRNASSSRGCSPPALATRIAQSGGSVMANGGSASVPAPAGHDNDCRVVPLRSFTPTRRRATPQNPERMYSTPAIPCSTSNTLVVTHDHLSSLGARSLLESKGCCDSGDKEYKYMVAAPTPCRSRVRSPSPKGLLRNAPISRACSPLASPRLVALSGGPVTADGGAASVPVPGSHDNHSRTVRARTRSPDGFLRNASSSRACSPSASVMPIARSVGSVIDDDWSVSVPEGHNNNCRAARVRNPAPRGCLLNAPISGACSPPASATRIALRGESVMANGGSASVPAPAGHDNDCRVMRLCSFTPTGRRATPQSPGQGYSTPASPCGTSNTVVSTHDDLSRLGAHSTAPAGHDNDCRVVRLCSFTHTGRRATPQSPGQGYSTPASPCGTSNTLVSTHDDLFRLGAHSPLEPISCYDSSDKEYKYRVAAPTPCRSSREVPDSPQEGPWGSPSPLTKNLRQVTSATMLTEVVQASLPVREAISIQWDASLPPKPSFPPRSLPQKPSYPPPDSAASTAVPSPTEVPPIANRTPSLRPLERRVPPGLPQPQPHLYTQPGLGYEYNDANGNICDGVRETSGNDGQSGFSMLTSEALHVSSEDAGFKVLQLTRPESESSDEDEDLISTGTASTRTTMSTDAQAHSRSGLPDHPPPGNVAHSPGAGTSVQTVVQEGSNGSCTSPFGLARSVDFFDQYNGDGDGKISREEYNKYIRERKAYRKDGDKADCKMM